MSIGGALIKIRREADLTQVEVAELLGIDQKTVSRMELDQTRSPLDYIQAIEKAAKVPLGTVLRLAGAVEDPQTLKEFLAGDPSLDKRGRQFVLNAYELARGDTDDTSKASSR